MSDCLQCFHTEGEPAEEAADTGESHGRTEDPLQGAVVSHCPGEGEVLEGYMLQTVFRKLT